VHLVGDTAYAGKILRGLPRQVTVTTRLRADAALYALAGPRRPGQRGRPRRKGERLPELIVLAGMVAISWQQTQVRCYGQRRTKELTSLVCLWYAVFGARPVQVVLARPPGAPDGYELAVVSTDLATTPPSWSNGTPTGGAWRSASKRAGRSWASGRHATAPRRRSSGPSRSGWGA
jgi:hypothetical protein